MDSSSSPNKCFLEEDQLLRAKAFHLSFSELEEKEFA